MGSKSKQKKKGGGGAAAAPASNNSNNSVATAPKTNETQQQDIAPPPLSPVAHPPSRSTPATAADLPSATNNATRAPGTSSAIHNEIVVIEDEDAHMEDMDMLADAGTSSVDNTSMDSTTAMAKYTRAEATLRNIEESLADIKTLLREGEYISAREVATLRSSLAYLLTDNKRLAKSELGVACLQDLKDVEASVLGAKDAETGDSESLTPFGFGEDKEPILASTVNRLQAKRIAENAAKQLKKKQGGGKQQSVPSSPAVKPTPASSFETAASSSGNKKKKANASATASPAATPKMAPKKAPQPAPPTTAAAKPATKNIKGGNAQPPPGTVLSDKPPAWKFVNIPPRRRLQTLVMSMLLFFTAVPAAIFISITLLLIPATMPFMLAYILYIIYHQLFVVKHPLQPWKPWTQSLFLQIYKDYFPCRLSIPRDYRPQFDRKRNYMFIYHPHGVHSFGVVCCFGADVHGLGSMLPGIKVHAQTLGINFWIPFWRHLTLWGGCGDASAGCIRKTLRSGPGQSIALVVGGAKESLLSSPKTNILCLNGRMGFVKIALETGSPLVPVFGFGETNVYYNFAHGSPLLKSILLSIQKRLGFAIPLISGRGYFNYNFGIFPHRRPIIVVVGEPLADMPQIPNPTREDVSFWHAKYIEALKAHYEKHKAVYDIEGTLEIE